MISLRNCFIIECEQTSRASNKRLALPAYITLNIALFGRSIQFLVEINPRGGILQACFVCVDCGDSCSLCW